MRRLRIRVSLLLAAIVISSIVFFKPRILRTIERVRTSRAEAFLKAAASSDAAAVEAFLNAGGDPNVTIPLHPPTSWSSSGGPALIEAAVPGHLAIVQTLLKRGAAPDTRAKGRWVGELSTAIHLSDSTENDLPDCGNTYIEMAASAIHADRAGITALMAAAQYGHTEIVNELLAHHADVHAKSQDGATALTFAAIGGHAEILEALLRNGARVDERTNGGLTPLMFVAWSWELRTARNNLATKADRTHTIELLLNAGANVNAEDKFGNTPLIGASGLQPNICALLLARGANLHAKNQKGHSALINAARRGHADLVQRLIAQGAAVNEKDHQGATALLHATDCPYPGAKGCSNLETVSVLLNNGANVNAQDQRGNTPLMNTLWPRDIEEARLLLARGAKVNLKDEQGKTALMRSVHISRGTEMTKLLLDNGADLETQDNRGWTALIYAAEEKYDPEYLRLLLERGARINHQNASGETSLLLAAVNVQVDHFEDPTQTFYHLRQAGAASSPRVECILATRRGDLAKLRRCLTRGISPNLQGPYQQSLLIYAAREGHVEIVEALLKAEADIDHQDYDRYSALMWASFNRHLPVVETLLAAGADVNLRNRFDRMALSLVTNQSRSDIVEKLLAAGADVHLKNANGKPLISLSGIQHDKATTALLKNAGVTE